MESTRRYPRHIYNDSPGIPVTIIHFSRLERIDLTVQCIDVSDGGLGIEADIPLSPGFVWFRDPVNKHNGGMIVWSRKADKGFRAGIQFLPIPESPDDYLQMTDD
jgi:hypothetical protein